MSKPSIETTFRLRLGKQASDDAMPSRSTIGRARPSRYPFCICLLQIGRYLSVGTAAKGRSGAGRVCGSTKVHEARRQHFSDATRKSENKGNGKAYKLLVGPVVDAYNKLKECKAIKGEKSKWDFYFKVIK